MKDILNQVTLQVNVEQLDEVVVESEREVTTGEAGLHRISTADVARIPHREQAVILLHICKHYLV